MSSVNLYEREETPKVYREVSEWFLDVTDGSGSVRNPRVTYMEGAVLFQECPKYYRAYMEGFGRTGRVRKVMEVSGKCRDDPGCLRKSGGFHNRCIHVALRDKEFPLKQIRIWQRRLSSSRILLAETYRNSSKLWGRYVDDPRVFSTYK